VAFVGTWIAQRIGNLSSAAIVGLLLLMSLVFNISQLPYQIWFKMVNLFVIATALVVGIGLAIRHKTAGSAKAN
jgi:hypothetical protein